MTPSIEMEKLALRIEKLEAQNRRWRRAGAALLVAAGAVVLMAQAKAAGTPKVVQANVFELVDKAGTVIATLDGRGGPSLVRFDITDGAGKDRISLVASADGSIVRLADAGGYTASLLVGKPGPALSLEDSTRKAQVALGISEKGAMFGLTDQGQLGAMIAAGTKGRGIALFDAAGKPTWSAP